MRFVKRLFTRGNQPDYGCRVRVPLLRYISLRIHTAMYYLYVIRINLPITFFLTVAADDDVDDDDDDDNDDDARAQS